MFRTKAVIIIALALLLVATSAIESRKSPYVVETREPSRLGSNDAIGQSLPKKTLDNELKSVSSALSEDQASTQAPTSDHESLASGSKLRSEALTSTTVDSSAQALQVGSVTSSSRANSQLESDGSFTLEDEESGGSKSAHRRQTITLGVVLTATTTNASFASKLCDDITNASNVQIGVAPSSPPTAFFLWPECMRLRTVVTSLVVTQAPVIFDDFGKIPSTVTFFTASNSIFKPENSTSVGFDATTGFLDFDAIFAHFPAMTGLQIASPTIIGATLPDTLPPGIIQFAMSNSLLSGPIPSSFFNKVRSSPPAFNIILHNNALSGPIPDDLMTPIASNSFGTAVVVFNFSSNQLAGTLPSSLFALNSASANGWVLDFSNNYLTGTVPVFTSGSSSRTWSIYLQSNLLTGALPSRILQTIPYSGSFTFLLDLSDNKLTSSIPADLLWSPTYNVAFSDSFTLKLRKNFLTGAIPGTLLRSGTFGFTSPRVTLDFGNNRLIGSIPSTLMTSVLSTTATSFTVALDGNMLSGTMPTALFDGVPTTGAAVTVSVSNNSLSGSPPTACWTSSNFSIDISHNELNESIPNAWGACRLLNVNLSNNLQLSGTIPVGLFGSSSIITSFDASYTNITGSLPNVTSTTLKNLVLDFDSSISFCDSDSTNSLSTYTGACSMVCTEANLCTSSFPMCDTSACPIPQVETPISTPSVACKGPAPSIDFVCIGGVWTATTTTTTTLTIPSSSGTVVVKGNVTSSTIVFSGIGGSIVIDGCATNLTHIVVQFTQEQLTKLGSKTLQTLITLSGNGTSTNCTDLGAVSVSSLVSGSSCKKLSTEKVVTGGTLSGFFTVDSSGCNRWWIILVSVIAGVIVIGVAIVIIVRVCWLKHKSSTARSRLRNAV